MSARENQTRHGETKKEDATRQEQTPNGWSRCTRHPEEFYRKMAEAGGRTWSESENCKEAAPVGGRHNQNAVGRDQRKEWRSCRLTGKWIVVKA